MNVRNLTAGILALTTGILYANLYDNEGKLKERYGEPNEPDADRKA